MIWTSAAIANRKKVAILITFLFPDFQQLWSSAEGEAKQTQCGTVSGVGLGSMMWRRYGALGRYAYGAMERHRCSVANRRGYGVMGRCVSGIMERHGCNGVERRERGAVGWCRCGAWSERGAAPWDGADSAL